MAVRTTMSAIVYFINPDSKLVKRVIGCFSAISGIVQAGLQIDVAVKAGGPPDVEGRRIAIATCT